MHWLWIIFELACRHRPQSAFSGRLKSRNVLRAKRGALWLLRLQKSAKRWQNINQSPNRRLVRMWQIFWRIFHLQWAAFQAFPYLCVSLIERNPSFSFVSTLKCPVRTISTHITVTKSLASFFPPACVSITDRITTLLSRYCEQEGLVKFVLPVSFVQGWFTGAKRKRRTFL